MRRCIEWADPDAAGSCAKEEVDGERRRPGVWAEASL